MSSRFQDWLKQADADLRHARNAERSHDFEWACFAAQQSAEKALKALFLRLGMEAWGHTVSVLLGNLPPSTGADEALLNRARMLDKHYIPTRYPNGFDSGAPTDFYTSEEAQQAIRNAEDIIEFCRRQIASSR